jgi:O-antigen ligase
MSEGLTFAAALPRPTPWRLLLGLMREDIFVLAMFLSLMLIGGDRVALQAGGLTLRLVFPVLMTAIAFLYMRRRGAIFFPATLSALFFVLAIAGAISIHHSMAVVKSIGYTIWVFFDFFIIILLCYNLARLYPPAKILSLWFLIFRIHVFLVFAEIAFNISHGKLERPFLWFYEPSYMAIFLTAYFGSALYLLLRVGKAYLLDFALSALVLLVSASATGIFGIVFAILLNFLVARQRLILLLWSVLSGALFLGVLYAFFGESRYFQLIAGFLLSGGPAYDLVLSRGGDRVVRFLVGWGAFMHNPWTGVGIGGDTAYMGAMPLPENATRYANLDTTGQPFCNIFIEVLGTMGILGFIPFCAILIYSVRKAVWLQWQDHPLAPVAMAFLIGFFCSILAMQLEGTVLRYYLWSPLGLALGVIAQMQPRTAITVGRRQASTVPA